MIVFPPAKINLGLNVVRKRSDGFHDLETAFMAIPLTDILEVIIDPTHPNGHFEITYTGLPIHGDPLKDLCRLALFLVAREREIPGLRFHLHKVIPMGAGLGGGSSDGAFTLRVLNSMLEFEITPVQLNEMALELGSDVPFFLHDQPMLGQGRGDLLTQLDLDLKGTWLHLVNPGIHVNTAEVYRNTIPSGKSFDLAGILRKGPGHWKNELTNTMEDHVFRTHPSIRNLKERLYENGAFYASMSGSGSSVFGMFREEPTKWDLAEGQMQWVMRI